MGLFETYFLCWSVILYWICVRLGSESLQVKPPSILDCIGFSHFWLPGITRRWGVCSILDWIPWVGMSTRKEFMVPGGKLSIGYYCAARYFSWRISFETPYGGKAAQNRKKRGESPRPVLARPGVGGCWGRKNDEVRVNTIVCCLYPPPPPS